MMEKGMSGDRLGQELEPNRERGDGLKDGEGGTPIAERREVADSNLLTVCERENLILIVVRVRVRVLVLPRREEQLRLP